MVKFLHHLKHTHYVQEGLLVAGFILALQLIDGFPNSNSGGSRGLLLRVAHCQEHLEDSASLVVDQTRDTLDTATASETADSGLGNAHDVVAKDLTVTLCAALAEAFATLATSRHD
jgi:hypothetical protein